MDIAKINLLAQAVTIDASVLITLKIESADRARWLKKSVIDLMSVLREVEAATDKIINQHNESVSS